MVVATVLAAASVAFVLLQRQQLESTLTDVARQQAADVADEVRDQGANVRLSAADSDQSLVQVVNDSGAVIAASPGVDGEGPVVVIAAPPGETVVRRATSLPIGEEDPFVIVAQGVQTPDGPVVVLVARSLESVGQATSVVARLLLIGYPLGLLVVALTSYWLTGRALSPVEAIRRRVATIEGTSELSARVPVPSGGDEIARLALTMNSMLARLQAGAEAQRRFAGDASHELRSPLSTIRVAHEVATVHPEAVDWPTTSREVLAELDRLDRLVADLLLLARADEHGLRLRPEPVDLLELVESEGDRLRRAGIRQVSVQASPVHAQADRHHLERALRNLTDNAARHARDAVTLRLSSEAGVATFAVADDGPGIPAAEWEHVFDRFVRLDESRTRDRGGSGLGLPIARQIARAHRGDVSVVESPTGACFLLVLPLSSLAPDQRSS